MEEKELLRIVTLRRGKLKTAEFKLRRGEIGLSLFAHAEQPNVSDVLEAVRSIGKQGVLVAAVIPEQTIVALGLKLVQTRGGTLHAGVNAIHYEARLPFLKRLILRLRGIRVHEYFNEYLSQQLCAIARVLD
jgi:hypothetical protein